MRASAAQMALDVLELFDVKDDKKGHGRKETKEDRDKKKKKEKKLNDIFNTLYLPFLNESQKLGSALVECGDYVLQCHILEICKSLFLSFSCSPFLFSPGCPLPYPPPPGLPSATQIQFQEL